MADAVVSRKQALKQMSAPEVGSKVFIVVIGWQLCRDLLVHQQRRLCGPAACHVLLCVPSSCKPSSHHQDIASTP